MRRIILIVGLPGSGKTRLGRTVSERLNGTFIDDPKSLSELPDNFSALIIADPFLCYKKDQDKALERLSKKYPDVQYHEWVFFENDPQQCLINAKRRRIEENNSKGVVAFINYATQHYHIRTYDLPIMCKVYKKEEK